MPIQLVPLDDGPTIVLDKPVLLVGRHRNCDVRLDSVKISRRHCCLAQVDGHLVVRDLGSTNGVRINGKLVLEGRLAGGDELTIGNLKWCVRDEAARVPRPVGSTPAPGVQGESLGGDVPVAIPVDFENSDSPSPTPAEHRDLSYLSGDLPIPISEDEESDFNTPPN